jgi:hypothetical protein
MSDEEPTIRVGSSADLARRMDRIEQRQEKQEAEMGVLTATVARVEINQNHAAELTKLRFDALERGVGDVAGTLKVFMGRIEGILSGEIVTQQSKAGQEMVADYREWREEVDTFIAQGRLIGRLVNLLIAGNAIAIIAGIAAFLK